MTREALDTLEEALESIGKWGKFQIIYYISLSFVVIFSVFTMNYIFVARDVKYRCFIEECDPELPDEATFLRHVVPFKDGLPEKCAKYTNVSQISSNNSDAYCFGNNTKSFEVTRCEKFVFERPERTIVHDFNLYCDENLWKLTIVGTVNVIGELVSLSYSGFLSDRFGRKAIMLGSLLLSSICGIVKSFSVHYYMYLVFEFLDTALGGAMYGAAFVLAMELVAAKDRNVGSTAISCVYALGQVIFGIVAWLSPNWRVMVRLFYFPGLLSIIIWMWLPESIRWLLSKQKTAEAVEILKRIANTNGKTLTSEEISNITNSFNKAADCLTPDEERDDQNRNAFLDSLRHPVLLIRIVHCSLTWVCCTFVFYGLTVHSVDISKNIYLSFILTALAEAPGYVIYYFANEKSGRRKLMSFSLLSGGVFCLAVGFLSEGWTKLMVFFCGKCCLTVAYTVLYVYTTELFPTCTRHATFSICSMFGRFGSMIAPQVPLMARISPSLPLFLFSGTSITFGFLALLFPETVHLPLPHTIDDALNIGNTRIIVSNIEI